MSPLTFRQVNLKPGSLRQIVSVLDKFCEDPCNIFLQTMSMVRSVSTYKIPHNKKKAADRKKSSAKSKRFGGGYSSFQIPPFFP